jgi:hypothetical protein
VPAFALVLALVLALGARMGAAADEGPKSVWMVRAPARPTIDGRIDEPVWSLAAPIRDFRQIEPIEGGQPSQRSELRLLYDADFLYLSFRAFDDQPEAIVAKQLVRDADQDSDDRIAFVIDTFHDRRNGYLFVVNPVGARRDGLVENNHDFRVEWDGIWYAKARIDAQGWTAEIAIPTKTVNFDPHGTRWGFNLMRSIRRTNETIRWSAVDRDLRFINLAEIGTLEGMVGLRQGLGLDVKPALALKSRYRRDRDGEPFDPDPSLDVVYKITPELTGVLTALTDFSEAEADERQINLTRFSLFFPEKRDFFLQDAGIFTFADLEGNGQPFFSRRIGLVGTATPVDLLGGAKVTGRIDRLNLGALHVLTEKTGSLDYQQLSVGRVAWNVLEESTIGAIVTHGDPESNEDEVQLDNTLVGTDFNYRNSEFMGHYVMTANAWVQRSFDPGVHPGTGVAYGGMLGFPNDRIDAQFRFKELERSFHPALGFVNRPDIREYRSEARYRFRPNTWVRTYDVGYASGVTTDRDDALSSAFFSVRPFELETQEGDTLKFRVFFVEEALQEPFVISEEKRVAIDAGSYANHGVRMESRTSEGRPVAAGIDLNYRGFFTGTLLTSRVTLELRPSEHLFFSLDYQQDDVRLPPGEQTLRLVPGSDPDDPQFLADRTQDGNFTTRVVRGRLNLVPSADLSWTNLVQFDTVSHDLGIQSRLRWIYEPGKELHLVLNSGFLLRASAHQLDRARLDREGAEAIAKISWTYRY